MTFDLSDPEQRARLDAAMDEARDRSARIMAITAEEPAMEAIVIVYRPFAVDPLTGAAAWTTETNAPDAHVLWHVLQEVALGIQHGTTLHGEGPNRPTPTTPGEEDTTHE